MSQENVEIVRHVLGLWNSGEPEWETRPEFFDPELRMDLRGRKINPAVYDGYEGLDRFTSDVAEVWAQFSVESVELIDAAPGHRKHQRHPGRDRGHPRL